MYALFALSSGGARGARFGERRCGDFRSRTVGFELTVFAVGVSSYDGADLGSGLLKKKGWHF